MIVLSANKSVKMTAKRSNGKKSEGQKKSNKKSEQGRRERFSAKLIKLAEMLPKYDKENPWSRLEILENAIQYLVFWKQDNKRTEELMKRLLLEIKHLKEIIFVFTEVKYQKYNIFKLSSVEIKAILKQLSDHNRRLCDIKIPEVRDKTCTDRPGDDSLSPGDRCQDVGDVEAQTAIPQAARDAPAIVQGDEQPKCDTITGGSSPSDVEPVKFLVKDNHLTSIQLLTVRKTGQPAAVSKSGQPALVSKSADTALITQPGQQMSVGSVSLISSPTSGATSQSAAVNTVTSPGDKSVTALSQSNTASKSKAIVPAVSQANRPKFLAPKPVSVAVVQPLNCAPGQRLILHSPVQPGLVLNGKKIYSIIPVNQLRGSLTSTVTCNTGLKVSVPAVQNSFHKKRPNRKRKSATTASSTSSQSNSSSQKPSSNSNENKSCDTSSTTQGAVSVANEDVQSADNLQRKEANETAVLSDGVGEPVNSHHLSQQSEPDGVKVSNCLRGQLEPGSQEPGQLQSVVQDTSQLEPGQVSQDIQLQHEVDKKDSGDGEPLPKVARLSNIDEPSDKEALSDIVDDLARLESNEELNIIQETITEDSASLHIKSKDPVSEVRMLPGDSEQQNSSSSIEEKVKEDAAPRLEAGDEDGVARLEDKGENSGSKEKRGEKKRSKSSYSIPALCQISVNIGERPDVASSPGVFSLNSVGTMSPTHTPVPTPDNKTNNENKNPDDPVIEELKTIRPEELLHQDTVDGVNIQIEITQALKDLDRELNLDTIAAASTSDDQQMKDIKVDSRPSKQEETSKVPCQTSESQNVYEFTEKPATPPPPLSKIRKESKSPRQAKEDAKHKQIPDKENKSKSQVLSSQDRKGGSGAMIQDGGGYPGTEGMEGYDSRLHNQHSTSANMKQLVYSHTPSAYHPGVQQAVQRNTYMGYHYQSGGGGAPGVLAGVAHSGVANLSQPGVSGVAAVGSLAGPVSDSGVAHHHQPANYPAYPHDSSDMKSSLGSQSYSCSSQPVYPPPNIQDFHSRSYYKNYGSSSHQQYRGFQHQQPPDNIYQYVDRKHRHHHHQVSQTGPGMPDKMDSEATGSFSVTQLVNSSQQHRKTSTKKSGSRDTNTKSHKKTDTEKQHGREPSRAETEKKPGKGASGTGGGSSSRRSRSAGAGGRSIYSTESLLQHPSLEHHQHAAANPSKQMDQAGGGGGGPQHHHTAPTKHVAMDQQQQQPAAAVVAAGQHHHSTPSSKNAIIAGIEHPPPPPALPGHHHTTPGKTQAGVDGGNLHATLGKSEDDKVKSSPYKNSSAMSGSSSSSSREKVSSSSSSRGGVVTASAPPSSWSNEMNQHFGSLPFTSLSPSPGLFSSELSSFEFGLLNPQDPSLGGRDYFGSSSTPQHKLNTKQQQQLACQLSGAVPSKQQQQLACQLSSSATPSKQQQQLACQLSATTPSKHQQQQLACQLSSAAQSNQRMTAGAPTAADWSTSGGIIEGGFLPPLPTLTPPTEDPMAYTFMSHSHSGFYSSACTTVSGQKGQNVYTTQSSTSGFSSSMMGKVHHNFGGGQMTSGVLPPGGPKGASNTGSLVNFNLSTIFPEINIAPGAGGNCQAKPLPGLPPLPTPEFLQTSRSGSSQLGSSELIPSHSLSILGHGHTSQVASFSVAPPGIPSNIVHTLPFTNIHE